MTNNYLPHIHVLAEDDANRQIANGFLLAPNLNNRAVKVLPLPGGWKKTVEEFTKKYASEMRQLPQRMMVLLIDFDDNENRLSYVESHIPDDLEARVFVLGVLSEPENLRTDIKKTFEEIGEALAKDCSDNTNELWGHTLLKHNKGELYQIRVTYPPLLCGMVRRSIIVASSLNCWWRRTLRLTYMTEAISNSLIFLNAVF